MFVTQPLLKGEIERAIALGTYSIEKHIEYFPTLRGMTSNSIKVLKIPTFRDVAEKWVSTIVNLAEGTQANYIKSLNFWMFHYHEKLITDIKYSDIIHLTNSKRWNSKNPNNMLIPLRKVFELAFLDEIITQNPTLKIKNEKVQVKAPNPLTFDEVNLVLEYMSSKFDDQIFNYFEFAFFTGCRPEEIIALKWESVDFEASTVHICRVRTAKTDRETTKTRNSRDIELNSRALKSLIRQKESSLKNDEYVFLNPVTKKRWNSESSQRIEYWKPTLLALGISYRVPYQTRHTFATMNLMAGANPMWISRQMGHRNMQMLLSTYSKWIDGADRKFEVSKIEKFLYQECHKNATKLQNY